MTPEQKIKHAIINTSAGFRKEAPPEVTNENVDDLYDELVEKDHHWDAMDDMRCTGIDTNIPCEYSSHYESKSVAMEMPDGSWVGWTFWYGGGKYGEPEGIDWMSNAYDLECKEEEKTVVVREFSKID